MRSPRMLRRLTAVSWTGEFDLNTLRVDGEIFESGKKKLRIQKYPDTCGRGLRLLTGLKNGRGIKINFQVSRRTVSEA